jgi:hypothetical protein
VNLNPGGGLPIVTRVVEQGDCFTIRLYFKAAASDAQIQDVPDILSERRALFREQFT